MDTQDANTMTIKHLIFSLLAMTVSALLHAEPQLIDRVVAVVDDDIIMESELEQRIKTVGVQSNQNELPEADTLREQVLERMITESVQLQVADRAGIRILGDAEHLIVIAGTVHPEPPGAGAYAHF